jgi:hypothetical protein
MTTYRYPSFSANCDRYKSRPEYPCVRHGPSSKHNVPHHLAMTMSAQHPRRLCVQHLVYNSRNSEQHTLEHDMVSEILALDSSLSHVPEGASCLVMSACGSKDFGTTDKRCHTKSLFPGAMSLLNTKRIYSPC